MEANLVVFANSFDVINTHQLNCIMHQYTAVGVSFNGIVVLKTDATVTEIQKHLSYCTIFLVDYKYTALLSVLKQATFDFIGADYHKCEFGYYCSNKGKYCAIINLAQSGLMVDHHALMEIFDVQNSFCIKVLGLSKEKILNKLKAVEGVNQFTLSLHCEFDDALLHFTPKDGSNPNITSNFKRALYLTFKDYIYTDEPKTLIESIEELLLVRNKKIAYFNNVSNTLNFELQRIKQNIYKFNEPINKIEVGKLFRQGVDCIINIELNQDCCDIEFFLPEYQKTFTYNFSNSRGFDDDFIANLVLTKILNYLYKNICQF